MKLKDYEDIRDKWRLLLIDLMFARHYTLGDRLGRSSAKNPVIDRLLPSLLHVKAVSILDYALRAWIDSDSGGSVVADRLRQRIDYLAKRKALPDCTPLRSVCDRRNKLAHEPTEALNWNELDRDISITHNALFELKILDEMPQWEIFAERSGAERGEVPGAISTFHYRIGIKEGEKVIAEIKWLEHLLADA